MLSLLTIDLDSGATSRECSGGAAPRWPAGRWNGGACAG